VSAAAAGSRKKKALLEAAEPDTRARVKGKEGRLVRTAALSRFRT